MTVPIKEAILALKSSLGPVDTYPGILLNRGCLLEVPDTDLEVGWGGGHPDPEIRGRGSLPKKCFSALQASVWSKNKWGGGAVAGPLP